MAKLLQVDNLSIDIRKDRDTLSAVEDVSFSLENHGSLGIVGESGCGKSITCLALTRLAAENIFISGGEVLFEGKSLVDMSAGEFQKLRGKAFSMIFQDSIAGLNPLIKVGRQVGEALEGQGLSREEIRARVLELLGRVGLPDVEATADKYPHQMSGGQRQRIMIAMAIAAGPRLLIADEPTTALDVTTQLQILSLLRQLQKDTGMGMIMISHDVGVIKEMCDEVMVMYSGHVVEAGPTRTVLGDPRHPYTIGLIESVSCAKFKGQPLHTIKGTVAPLEQRQLIKGCIFGERCGVRCGRYQEKVRATVLEDGRRARCHRLAGQATGKEG